MTEHAELESLLQNYQRRHARAQGAALNDASLQAFELRSGFLLPENLRSWLRLCNGLSTTAGNFYGISTGLEGAEIEKLWGIFLNWKPKNWIPIADDGCGNYYCVLGVPWDGTRKMSPVFFVDTMSSPCEPAYFVASSVSRFFEQILRAELGDQEWPFTKSNLQKYDPELLAMSELRPPS